MKKEKEEKVKERKKFLPEIIKEYESGEYTNSKLNGYWLGNRMPNRFVDEYVGYDDVLQVTGKKM